jgi:hypothetical protein
LATVLLIVPFLDERDQACERVGASGTACTSSRAP